jgi:hypothetical protein
MVENDRQKERKRAKEREDVWRLVSNARPLKVYFFEFSIQFLIEKYFLKTEFLSYAADWPSGKHK